MVATHYCQGTIQVAPGGPFQELVYCVLYALSSLSLNI